MKMRILPIRCLLASRILFLCCTPSFTFFPLFFPPVSCKTPFFTLKVVCACRANHYSLHTKGRESFFFFSKTSLHRHPYTGLQLAALVNTTSTAHGDTCTRRAFVQKKKRKEASARLFLNRQFCITFFSVFSVPLES